MARVRLAAYAALLVLLLVAGVGPGPVPRTLLAAPAGAVTWPPSSGVVVAEVVTGGVSASDEYVELANAGPAPADLAGLEVVYATSSGASVTRKTGWTTSLVLEPGQHLLLANSLGVYAPLGDAVYSGGLAASGGTIVLRAASGTPADAVGWGDAANAFVEGSAAAAPAAGRSIERLPGGSSGNSVDTNDNARDFVVNAAPVPQGLAAGPVPSPTPSSDGDASPTPSPSPTLPSPSSPVPTSAPTAEPTPAASADTTPDPTALPSASPSPALPPADDPTASPPVPGDPSPGATPTPAATTTPAPSAAPDPTTPPDPTLLPDPTTGADATPAPSLTPTPDLTATPSPSPTAPPIIDIATVRTAADGARAAVEGVLTTSLGAIDGGRGAFVQDSGAGIAVYLDAPAVAALPAGTRVRLDAVLGTRYGERVLRTAEASLVVLGKAAVPDALGSSTGGAGEALEGLRLSVTGIVTDTPDTLSDGAGVTIDDGSGPLRLVVAPAAVGTSSIAAGAIVTASGPLGQRDSTGTRTSGYRLHVTQPGDLVVTPAGPSPAATESPSPVPSPSPAGSPPPATPAPSGGASPSPVPGGTATPGPTPASSGSVPPGPTPSPVPTTGPSGSPSQSPAPTASPTPVLVTVAQARLVPIDGTAAVRGVVVAEAGRLGTPSLVVLADATGGIPVRLADGQPAPARGMVVEANGFLAAPYGQTELRQRGALVVAGTGQLPAPLAITPPEAGEATEGRLARTAGTITAAPSKATSGDIAFAITGPGGSTLRIYADASAGIDPSTIRKGATVTLTGIVGQRASRKGALDGYRLWLRDRADVSPGAATTASATPAASASSRPAVAPVSIAAARVRDGATVTIEATVTTSRLLLDASGRRAVVEDATGAIEVYLARPLASVRTGVRVRATGTIGRAWGAPRLRVTALVVLGAGRAPVHELRVTPGAATEWRLVRVTGAVGAVHADGDRWTAEVVQGGRRILVVGLPGSGIRPVSLVQGRTATVTGIVKRPYPTATDRRFAIAPRAASDVVVGPAGGGSPAGTGTAAGGTPAAGARAGAAGPRTPDGPSRAVASPAGADAGTASPGAGTGEPRDIELRDLAGHAGERVRVGGLVTTVEPGRLRLDDGTATARIVLSGAAADLAVVVSPGDALNATGVPRASGTDAGAMELVVADPADVVLLGDLGGSTIDPAGDPDANPAGAAVTGPAGTTTAALLGPDIGPGSPGLVPIDAALAGNAGPDGVLLLVVAPGVAAGLVAGVAAWRRYRSVTRTRRRIAARLARVRPLVDTSPGGPAAA